MNKKFLSAEEVRTLYQISTTALYKAISEEKISKYKKKGKAFFLKTEADKLWGQPHLVNQKIKIANDFKFIPAAKKEEEKDEN